VRYTERTLKRLFGLSGNQCAFPGCIKPVIDSQTGLPIGQICHIKGKSPNGPRYDPNQSEHDRNDYPNLLVMCPVHNKTVLRAGSKNDGLELEELGIDPGVADDAGPYVRSKVPFALHLRKMLNVADST